MGQFITIKNGTHQKKMAGVYLFCLMLCSSPLAPQNCYQNPKSYAMSLVKSALKTHLGFDVRRARNFHASPGFEPAGLSPDHPNSKLSMHSSPIQVILVQIGIPGFSPKNWRIPEPGCSPQSDLSASSGARSYFPPYHGSCHKKSQTQPGKTGAELPEPHRNRPFWCIDLRTFSKPRTLSRGNHLNLTCGLRMTQRKIWCWESRWELAGEGKKLKKKYYIYIYMIICYMLICANFPIWECMILTRQQKPLSQRFPLGYPTNSTRT